jgi:glucose-1-phosphate adenylyltransferase
MKKQTDVLAIILGGGAGSRLHPLTKRRAKPAVPIGGQYRLVDIPISNCLNSGLQQIYVLTQYNSVSLHRHITQTYKFDLFSKGWVQILAAEQTPRSNEWYQGTADAIRKQLPELRAMNPREVLILSGDHLYRMDYQPFIQTHRATQADLTLAMLPVTREETPRLGIVELDAEGRVIKFHEKPASPPPTAISPHDPQRPYLASMGIYLFRAEVLYDLLESHNGSDFGKHILPASLEGHRVMAYPFDGYWEDIGTIRAFYEANLALAQMKPAFSFYDAERPIYTHPRFLPPTAVDEDCILRDVLLADGSKVINSHIHHSVVGVRSLIGPGATVTHTVTMGADYYESESEQAANAARGIPSIGIGPGCVIEGAIIDKNARIGAGVVIRHLPHRADMETEHYAARDGIIVVMKDGIIPTGTVI